MTGGGMTWQDLVGASIYLVAGGIIFWLIGRWRRRLLGKPGGQSEQVVALLARVGQMLVLAIFIGAALTKLGSDVGFLTVMVLVALLIAVLGARPVLEGMGASAALTLRPAFKVGDEISIGDFQGEVVEFTNRSTVIRQPDATTVHIPNVEMLNKTVVVLTVDEDRRSEVLMTLAFGTDLEHAESVVADALGRVEEITRVDSVQATSVVQGISLSIKFWHAPSINATGNATDAAIRASMTALENEGVEFAPPITVSTSEGHRSVES
ncbi:MAG: mechanosensitive ion channel domain-containing protein [Acidimicrobiales bacterium]